MLTAALHPLIVGRVLFASTAVIGVARDCALRSGIPNKNAAAQLKSNIFVLQKTFGLATPLTTVQSCVQTPYAHENGGCYHGRWL